MMALLRSSWLKPVVVAPRGLPRLSAVVKVVSVVSLELARRMA